jgi:hypothetical protein
MYVTTKGAIGACALFLSAMAPLALGAPTVSGVSGTLSSGQTVTVRGSGFGTKPTAAPVLWDNFEGGNSGSLIQGAAAPVGRWDTGAGSENPVYSTAKAHSGAKSAYNNFVNNYNSSLAKNMTFTRLYMDFWINADYLDQKSRNFKPWRLYGDNDSYQLDYVWLCNGNLMNRVQDSAGFSQGDWGGPNYSDNQWMHIQLVYNESSPNVANGTVRHFINSQVAGNDSGAIMTEKTSAHFEQIRIGHYWDRAAVDACPSNSGASVYVDDVYIDTSWARVELGNASTYSGSTHREVQLASTWADGSIAVKFNPGSFASGSTAYLFVTDANNNTSPGIAVTIGGASTPPPTTVRPSPPTGVN